MTEKEKTALRNSLAVSSERLAEINNFLTDPENELIGRLLEIIERYGGPEEINRKAEAAGNLQNLLQRLKDSGSAYHGDVEWLIEQRDRGSFISLEAYKGKILGGRSPAPGSALKNPVTLEISALQFFPWLIAEAEHAIKNEQLMPGRIIRVRNMKEQEKDDSDILAVAAAVNVIGASYVETLDTKGTDGSNVHLGGPETITGYFGGVGEPNDYPYRWADEYLYYYTNFGIRQVLNVNSGTILLAYLMHKLGIRNEFKISVFMGNDNPFAVLWTLMAARLLSADDGSTSLIGFNFANSVNNDTIRSSHTIREALGLTENVRFEHHITETYKSIVRQPYNRRKELVSVAADVPNISAKHEGGDPETDGSRDHPSDILDYFLPKDDILQQGLMEKMKRNYLDKHEAMNKTAEELLKAGVDVICAKNLHSDSGEGR